MVFQVNTYSVLLISASEKFTSITLPLLPASDYYPVTVVHSVNEARRRLINEDFDLVIVNSPLPDEAGVQFAADVCSSSDSGVLLLVRNEVYEDTYYQGLSSGVVTLSKPISQQMMSHNLRVLCSIRERLRRVKTNQATLEEKMDEIRLINRAKLLLIQKQGLTEQEAHRYLQRQAMERHISKRETAEDIIRNYQ